MENQFMRTELIIGKENIKKLNHSKIAVFGLGGVGSYVVEGLARAGIGNFILVDNDKVDITNINRQLIATHKTIGKNKVDVEKERILAINPSANVETFNKFFSSESEELMDNSISYVIDAIDTVSSKVELICRASKQEIPIISCMGTGNKLDPTKFEITDIYRTTVCPLAKIMRKELKKNNINKLKVLYSKEIPVKQTEKNENGKIVPGSISFVPAVAGLIIAGEVIKDIINS